jgi:predicted dehydrogenase
MVSRVSSIPADQPSSQRAQRPPSKPIRIGIIGTGGMANAHAAAFAAIPGVQLAACMDVVPGRAEAFAAKHHIALATSQRARFFDAVDAVSIVTPDRFHSEPAIASFEAGKHVLCEKPLTVTLAEARAVAAAAAARPDLIGMVNFSYRRSAAAQQAARIVADGRLGALRHVNAHYLQSWLVSDAWGGWSSEAFLWRLQTAAGSGGVLGDIGVHILDLTTMVAGDADRLRCEWRTFPKAHGDRFLSEWPGGQRLDANDSAVIELDFASGAFGIVQASRWATGHANHLRVEVHGSHGALRFDLDESYERLQLCSGRDVHRHAWKARTYRPAPDMWQRFCKAVREGRPDQPSIARGAQVQAMLDACERSAREQTWLPIPAVAASTA